MMLEYTFVNRIVGTAHGFRDVALNYVRDKAAFDIPQRSANDFPVATRDKASRNIRGWNDFKRTTLWHDDSHWMFLGHAHTNYIRDTIDKLRVPETTILPLSQETFPQGTEFRLVVEDMRAETIALIQNHFNQNVALVHDGIWQRADEPCYILGLDTISEVSGKLHASSDLYLGFQGQRFRLDDQDNFREAILDYIDRGRTLLNSDGIVWNVPDMEILVPESITLEAEAQTIVDFALTLRDEVRTNVKNMSYQELESYCHIKDTLGENRPTAASYHEDTITDLLDSTRQISRYTRTNQRMNGEAVALIADKWENRPIGNFLAARGNLATL
jgi:hypothetical protein